PTSTRCATSRPTGAACRDGARDPRAVPLSARSRGDSVVTVSQEGPAPVANHRHRSRGRDWDCLVSPVGLLRRPPVVPRSPVLRGLLEYLLVEGPPGLPVRRAVLRSAHGQPADRAAAD